MEKKQTYRFNVRFTDENQMSVERCKQNNNFAILNHAAQYNNCDGWYYFDTNDLSKAEEFIKDCMQLHLSYLYSEKDRLTMELAKNEGYISLVKRSRSKLNPASWQE